MAGHTAGKEVVRKAQSKKQKEQQSGQRQGARVSLGKSTEFICGMLARQLAPNELVSEAEGVVTCYNVSYYCIFIPCHNERNNSILASELGSRI